MYRNYLHFLYMQYTLEISYFKVVMFLYSLSSTYLHSAQSLSLPDRDPKGLGIGSDGLAVIATLQEIIVARDGKRVSAFKPSYEPTCISFHPSQPEVVIGGTVRVCACVCVCVYKREREGESSY